MWLLNSLGAHKNQQIKATIKKRCAEMSGVTNKRSILSGVDLRAPIHKGYMFKQSHVHKSFNKRFFALYPKVLIYYEHQHEFDRDVSRGTLEHRHRAIRLEHLYLTKPEKKPHGAKFCFVLNCPNKLNDRTEILLVTDSRERRREWMDVLQKQNPQLIEHHHQKKPSGEAQHAPKTLVDSDEGSDNGHGEVHQLEVREGSSDHEDN